ncbi:sensor histidine kinase [Alkalibacillus haloalkaliphilus]|uniref:histidine kinase n=1 Tax=Alkalibacillus haloalkaliphilus TaxID=94136 RepID=A0A511W0D4_9BACI|nr:ATP-binding protein [Alkalibacillus haloalkaliphilus]GEN44549.1 hypothetical protein AHA02nite_03250 [Alkalibacillus haloalkaliphilus]
MFRKNPFFKGLLFRLTLLNMLIISVAIILSSFAIYQTACFLVESISGVDSSTQSRFEALLFEYLVIFTIVAILIAGILHFYLTRNLIRPIRQLIQSTKELKSGQNPSLVQYDSNNEVGELIEHYNGLIDQLKQQDEVRNKMIADLSHELRTPVSNLNGYLYAMKSGVIEASEETLQALHLESQRLKQLIEQVDQLKELDYISAQQFINHTVQDVSDVIKQSVSVFEWSFSQASIPVQVDVEACMAKFNQEGIQQVINNLLDNALRYHEGDQPVLVRGYKNDGNYYASVTTSGKPIPTDEQDKIFERFYRVDHSRSRESGGSGLGLSIAKEIIEKHDGTIGVKSYNHSNEFWFVIPIRS